MRQGRDRRRNFLSTKWDGRMGWHNWIDDRPQSPVALHLEIGQLMERVEARLHLFILPL